MNLGRWIIEFPYTFAAISLLMATVMSTLRAAYRLAGEAGIPRLMERFESTSGRLKHWEEHWPRLVVTLNLFSIFFRLGFVTLLLYALLPIIPHQPLLGFVFLGSATLVVWIFCYLIPHTVSEAFADRLSVECLPVVGFLTRILRPISAPLSWTQQRLLHHVLLETDEESRPSPEDEIRSVVEQALEEEMDPGERQMIRGIFELGETSTREIMTPRVNMISIEDEKTVQEAALEIRDTAHSRFPIHQNSMDEIIGVVHVKDLIHALSSGKESDSIQSVAKPVIFVPESMPVQDLLAQMQRGQYQMSIVVDEYGGTAGLVTMEDVIEEIVGEIHDEYDQAKLSIQPISETAYILDAKINLEELNERLDTEIPVSEEYDSLGGYILDELGHIPPVGEQIDLEDCVLTIKSATAQQIITVQCDLKQVEKSETKEYERRAG